jgi:selenocysteine lyase/cysteine desulfurase
MDINQLRSETKSCNTTIHFNNAGAALMPDVVLQTVQNYTTFEAEVGGYEAAYLRDNEIKAAYAAVARLINAKVENIAFTSSATDAYNRALSSIIFQSGDVILTTESDYISNHIAFMALQKRFGIFVHNVPNNAEGEIDIADFERVIKKINPKLVAVTHVPTNSGLVQPVIAIGELCKKYDILYLVDACQSVGQLEVDVEKIHCDFLSATSRKFLRGPRGIGFLYVSDKALALNLEPLFIDLAGAIWTSEKSYTLIKTAKRFEDWEFNYSLVLGMGVAAAYCVEVGIKNIENQNKILRDYLTSQLQTIKKVKDIDIAPHLSNIVMLQIENYDVLAIRNKLYDFKINTAYSHRTSALIDYTKKNVQEALRLSPHYYNTKQEIDFFIEKIATILH